MTEKLPLYEVFYCSQLAPDLPPTTVGTIASKARASNARHGITGLLVFDGLRFWQHLEGPRAELETLVQHIARDPRHTDVRIVYTGSTATRRYNTFGLGLAESEGPDLMAGVHALDGEVALRHFLALRPSFDVNG